jgi:hypothetical protein
MSEPLPIKDQLVVLFNEKLAQSGIETEYVLNDLVFGEPEAYDPDTIDPAEPEGANTSILVTAGEGLEQIEYRLHYCRLDLARLASIRSHGIAIVGEPTSTHDLLTELSAHVKFELTEDDIDDLLIEDNVVSLVALSTSLAVIGQTSFTIALPENQGSD